MIDSERPLYHNVVIILLFVGRVVAEVTYHPLPPVNETLQLHFNPPQINSLTEHAYHIVVFNCSQYHDVTNATTSYLGLIQTTNVRYAGFLTRHAFTHGHPLQSQIFLQININRTYSFSVKAIHVGHITMTITILSTDAIRQLPALLLDEVEQDVQAIAIASYNVSIVRGHKYADIVFDCAVAGVAILISFGIGCLTDVGSLKRQLKYPVSLVIGFICQFLLMPLLAFGIATVLQLDTDMQFGMLCVACVPGGGLAHIAVIIGEADLPLSLTMNMISVVSMLGAAPLWIFVLGQHFQRSDYVGSKSIPIYNFEIWLASTFFAYTAGLVINRFRPMVADALLNWIIKPLLLLVSILYITLGVYINMYVFDIVDQRVVFAAILLPLMGCIMSYLLSRVFQQKTQFCKTVALETASMNCLIVLAALRFTLPQPSADLASTIPIWIMFTIPGLYVSLAILRIVKQFFATFLENRKQKQFRQFSIVSGIMNQANLTTLSAPLFVQDGEEENGPVNEKVTVL